MTTISGPGALAAVEYGVMMPVEVHFDEMDPFGMLNNTKHALLVDRAWNSYWLEIAKSEPIVGEAYLVAREMTIVWDTPVTSYGPYAVHLWVDQIGRTSLTWGFRLCSTDGVVSYAHGTRVKVCLDPATKRPAPWADRARELYAEIAKPGA